MYLVLLESSGNQDYLFASNRMSESVGASELTYRSGTQVLMEALEAIDPGAVEGWAGSLKGNTESPEGDPLVLCGEGDSGPFRDYLDPPGFRKWLLEERKTAADGAPFEVVTATSGKAMLLTGSQETAREIVALVTERLAEQAPGLDMAGVQVELDWNTPGSLNAAIREAHILLERVRNQRPHPSARFPHLPVFSPCATSGLPAWGVYWPQGRDDEPEEPHDISRTAAAKRRASRAWNYRVARISGGTHERWVPRMKDLEAAFDGMDWLGIVHADGNGLGWLLARFYTFAARLGVNSNAEYVRWLRDFSLELEEATETAYRKALRVLPRASHRGRRTVPLAALVCGGDDLTVVCDGRYALPFAREFLLAFERETARRGKLKQVAGKAFGVEHLSACAGVAIIKPHFPFHRAYDLAEQLIESAKEVKRRVRPPAGQEAPFHPCSALDFHILYDASGSNLSRIRRRLLVDGGSTSLTAKPYVVTPIEQLKNEGAEPGGLAWAEAHHLGELLERVGTMNKQDDGRRAIPNTQLHALREGLFQGRAVADGRLLMLRGRYCQLDAVAESGGSLFRACPEPPVSHETRFLDALDSMAFWKHKDDSGNSDDGRGEAA